MVYLQDYFNQIRYSVTVVPGSIRSVSIVQPSAAPSYKVRSPT